MGQVLGEGVLELQARRAGEDPLAVLVLVVHLQAQSVAEYQATVDTGRNRRYSERKIKYSKYWFS